jgi:serine/threonine-protein kinase
MAGVLGALMLGGAGTAYYYLQPFSPADPGKLAANDPSTSPVLNPGGTAAPPSAITPTPTPTPGPAPSSRPGDVAILIPPQKLNRAGEIERYISQYNGGDCFFISPNTVSASAARIDGYGDSPAAFEILDDAFKRTNGFEADIDVRQVTPPQCPAITFLGRLRGERSRALRLRVATTNLKRGETLVGTIEGAGNSSVQLLLVSEEGEVQDLSRFLKPAGDARSFNLVMQREGAAGAQPQLLIAVTSTKPLETLRDAKSPADRLFPLALVEATRTGQSIGASVLYFKLDR